MDNNNNNNNINPNDPNHNNLNNVNSINSITSVNINAQTTPTGMIDEANLVNTGQQQTQPSYISMVNVAPEQQPTNDFYNYYFNSTTNNPQPSSNILQQQQQQQQQQQLQHNPFIEEHQSAFHDVQQQQQMISNMQVNLQQSQLGQLQNHRFAYTDPTNELQQQHQQQMQRAPQMVVRETKMSRSPYGPPQPPPPPPLPSYGNVPSSSSAFDSSRTNSQSSTARLSIGENHPAYLSTISTNAGPQQAPSPNTYVVQQYNHNAQTLNYAHMPGVYSKASPATVLWLLENYEAADGVSLPRCLLYSHYIFHCQKCDSNPVNSASFGKLIRSLFPNLKTRRLGTRGKSKYHYYGIRIRDNSILHNFGRSEDEVIDFLNERNEPFLRKILPQHPSLLKSMSQSTSDMSANSELTQNNGPISPHNLNQIFANENIRKTNNRHLDEDGSIINISFRNDTENNITTSQNNTDDDCNFEIKQFAKYFPNEEKHVFGESVTQDYPTMSDYSVCVGTSFTDEEYENFSLAGESSKDPCSSKNAHPISRLKHYLKYLTKRLMPFVPQLNTDMFIQVFEKTLRQLNRLVELGSYSEQNEARAIFECKEIIELNRELDLTLYQFLVHRLFPKIFTHYPSQYISYIRAFARKLIKIVEQTCTHFSEQFKKSKIQNVKAFSNVIRHYTYLSHIYNGAVSCIQNEKQTRLAGEMSQLEVEEIFVHEKLCPVCPTKQFFSDAAEELIELLNTPMNDPPKDMPTLESNVTSDIANIANDAVNVKTESEINTNEDETNTTTASIASEEQSEYEISSEVPTMSRSQSFRAQRVDHLLDWMRNVKTEFIRDLYNDGHKKPTTVEQYCHLYKMFTHVWNHSITSLVREMTLQGSTVFGFVHILHLLFFEFLPHMLQQDLFDHFNVLPIEYYIRA